MTLSKISRNMSYLISIKAFYDDPTTTGNPKLSPIHLELTKGLCKFLYTPKRIR